MHHPWRAFRAMSHFTLEWSQLPEGVLGITDYRRRTVTLALGMTEAERRCTIAHEVEHILRGPVPSWFQAREEREIEAVAARKLIAIRDLAEALAWADDEAQVADELWVDVATVRARLARLRSAEQDYLRRRLVHRAER